MNIGSLLQLLRLRLAVLQDNLNIFKNYFITWVLMKYYKTVSLV